MSIYVGKDKATLFHGDHHPASFYKGDKLIAGFEKPTLTGTDQISFQSPYKANMDAVKAYGVGKQDGTPNPDYPIEPKFYPGGTITDGTITAQIPILRALPDGSVRDEYDVRTGVLTRRIGEKRLQHSDRWRAQNINDPNGLGVYVDMEDWGWNRNVYRFSFYCTHGEADISGITGKLNACSPNSVYSNFLFNVLKADFPNVTAWKSFLKINEVYVYYPLATPIIEHLPPKLLTQHPTTTILTQTPNEVPIKKTVEGQVIAADDVGKEVHEVECKVESTNKIPFPYVDKTKTVNGITFTDNGDGTVTTTGIATDTAAFRICNNLPIGKDGVTVSGCPAGGDASTYSIRIVIDDATYSDYEIGKGIFFDETHSITWIEIRLIKGADCKDGLIFRPMVSNGREMPLFSLNIPDLSKVMVSRFGGNQIKMPYASQSGTSNGITAIVKEDGSIILNGTATGIYYFDITKERFVAIDRMYIAGASSSKAQFVFNPTYPIIDSGNGAVVAPGAETNNIYIYVPKGTHLENEVVYPGLFVFSEKQTLTPLPPGEISGMTSLSPNMTILTDNPGAVITAKYDTNQNEETVFADMSAKVYKEL